MLSLHVYRFLDAEAEECASLNFCLQSSQQTSTVLPPIFTLIGFAFSLHSQAAQVFALIRSSPGPKSDVTSRPWRK